MATTESAAAASTSTLHAAEIVRRLGAHLAGEPVVVVLRHRHVAGLGDLHPHELAVPLALDEGRHRARLRGFRRGRDRGRVAVRGGGRHRIAHPTDRRPPPRCGERQDADAGLVVGVVEARAAVEAVVIELRNRQVADACDRDPEECASSSAAARRVRAGDGGCRIGRLRERELGLQVLRHAQPADEVRLADDRLVQGQLGEVQLAGAQRGLFHEG